VFSVKFKPLLVLKNFVIYILFIPLLLLLLTMQHCKTVYQFLSSWD